MIGGIVPERWGKMSPQDGKNSIEVSMTELLPKKKSAFPAHSYTFYHSHREP